MIQRTTCTRLGKLPDDSEKTHCVPRAIVELVVFSGPLSEQESRAWILESAFLRRSFHRPEDKNCHCCSMYGHSDTVL